MARVCVVGSVNMDLSFAVDALPRRGQTVLASSMTRAPGGKGANQAVAAARAGARVQFAGAFGDDAAAEELRAHLLANGVGLSGAVEIPGASGTAMVVVDANGDNTIVVAPGANGRLTEADVPAVVADCEVLLTQLEIPVPAAAAAARLARSAGAVVVVNASPAAQHNDSLEELAAAADVVIANETEADEWPWRPAHLVVTLGERGARYVGVDGEFAVPAPAVAAIDTSGAGDVFAGVLAANWPPRPGAPTERLRALRRACAAGALATLVPGAGDCAPGAEAIEAAALARG